MVKRKCVAEELFGRSFTVDVPLYAVLPEEDLKTRGIAGHHDKEGLDRIISGITTCRASLPQIAEFIDKGIPVYPRFTVNDYRDGYNLICDHIENWLHIGYSHGIWVMPPMEDLLKLDQLADYLFSRITFPDIQPMSLTDVGGLLSIFNKPSDANKPTHKPYKSAIIDLMTQGIYREGL